MEIERFHKERKTTIDRIYKMISSAHRKYKTRNQWLLVTVMIGTGLHGELFFTEKKPHRFGANTRSIRLHENVVKNQSKRPVGILQ